MKNIKQKKQFYIWFVKNGGDVSGLEVENLQFYNDVKKKTPFSDKLIHGTNRKSSFKNRPSEIKEKYNHVFKDSLEKHLKGMKTLSDFIENKLNVKTT